jgi:Zn finger protein HypA/HybF involved in hydrogenase expression
MGIFNSFVYFITAFNGGLLLVTVVVLHFTLPKLWKRITVAIKTAVSFQMQKRAQKTKCPHCITEMTPELNRETERVMLYCLACDQFYKKGVA